MRLKIIHTISNSGTGGGQTHLLELLKHTDRTKFEVLLICHENGHYVNDFQTYADKIYKIDYDQNPILVIANILRIVRREKPSILHNHLLRSCFLGGTVSVLSGVKCFNNLHGDIEDDQNQGSLKKRFYQIANTWLSKMGVSFICVSQYNKTRLEHTGVTSDRITVVYNGVKDPFFTAETSGREIFNVLCTARLHPAKGIETILRAAPNLSKPIMINIVGDGPLANDYEKYITENNIQNVSLHGFQTDVTPFLKSADLFLLSSNWEGLPIAIVEAMSYKLPVLATNVGGISEIIHDSKGGKLFIPKDSFTLATLLNEMCLKREECQLYGNYNYIFYQQNLTLETMIECTEELYISQKI
jgi:glycosyltransferase involved in cell wall biosynthesis